MKQAFGMKICKRFANKETLFHNGPEKFMPI